MKKIVEQDRELKALDVFESKDCETKKVAYNIFELYRPMVNGDVIRIRSAVTHGK